MNRQVMDLQLFALELTEEQQKEVDALIAAKTEEQLKSLGYDQHAKDVIKRLNDEAKSNREAKEALEKRLTPLEEAEAARVAEQKRKDDEEKARKAKEAPIEEKLAAVETKNAADVATLQKQLKDAENQRIADAKKRDDRLVFEAVRSAAKDLGIIDPDDVKYPDLSKIPIEDGVVDRDAVGALVEEWAEKKPHLFKGADQRDEREERTDVQPRDPGNGQFVRPKPKNSASEVDAAKLNDAEFDALTDRLRRGKA